MKLGKSSKNRTFNYQPRFSGDANSTSTDKDFVSKWKEAQGSSRKVKSALPLSILVILLVLLLIGIYYLNTFSNN
ncbi:hypothetical protein ACFS5J_06300 [Flavobacterium chuncheonense]|uniref:Uncharacterized protein n=1 Tax=Flavobacterium chuncheonense TaxID=2026653 RepID=A0ABW5YMI1_9FLAO